MRIKLQKGKQEGLILLAKNEQSWKILADKININEQYLSHELKNEERLLSDNIYKKLCELTNIEYDNFIEKKLHDNWGRSKGGINSPGSTIKLPNIEFNEKFAEFIGAVLGDGNVNFYKKGKKIGVYHVRIAGDLNKDKDYHINHLKKLCKGIFNLEAREIIRDHERFLDLYSRELVKTFILMGIKPGNKIVNQSTIPKWIYQKNSYLKACLRGLIDTDGSIHRMSQKDYNLIRISFTNYNLKLLKDTRESFIKLEYHPSKIILNKTFYISRQQEINKYLKEIGFSNKKHQDRAKIFLAS